MSGDVFWTVDLTKEQLDTVSDVNQFIQLTVWRSWKDLADADKATMIYIRRIESLMRVVPALITTKAGDK